MTLPSRATSSTRRNSIDAPVSPGSFSIEMTCPGATRYCLPPVAMTASMDPDLSEPPRVTSPYLSTRRRPAQLPPGPRGRLLRALHVLGEALAHEQARPVHPRLHRRQADAERLGDVGIRQPFDVVQHQGRSVVVRQRVDRGREHAPKLALQRLLVDPIGPVIHRLEVLAVPA